MNSIFMKQRDKRCMRLFVRLSVPAEAVVADAMKLPEFDDSCRIHC